VAKNWRVFKIAKNSVLELFSRSDQDHFTMRLQQDEPPGFAPHWEEPPDFTALNDCEPQSIPQSPAGALRRSRRNSGENPELSADDLARVDNRKRKATSEGQREPQRARQMSPIAETREGQGDSGDEYSPSTMATVHRMGNRSTVRRGTGNWDADTARDNLPTMLSEEFAACQEAQATRDQPRPPPPEAMRNVSSAHTDDGDRATDTLQEVGDGDGSVSPTRAPQDDVDATPDEPELTDGRMPSVQARTPNRARFRWGHEANPDDPALRHSKLADAVLEYKAYQCPNGTKRLRWKQVVLALKGSDNNSELIRHLAGAESKSCIDDVADYWKAFFEKWKMDMRIEEGKSGCAADFSALDNVLAVIAKAEYDGEGLREAPTPGTTTPRNLVRGRQEAQEVLDAACAVATGAVRRNLQETRTAIDNQPEGAEDDDVIDMQAGQPERPNPRARVPGRARTVLATREHGAGGLPEAGFDGGNKTHMKSHQ